MSRPSPPHPILQQHFDSSQLAFTQIDKEIAVLQESIRILHTFRNTFTPVYRLPPEVLTRIFVLFQHLIGHETYDSESDSALPQWAIVTRVSQHWRDVAVGCPNLWFHITDAYPKHMISQWLHRSKDIPLSITLSKSSVADSQFIGTSLPRIRELTLKLPPVTWNGLSLLLSSPAPLLESFCVSITDSETRTLQFTISDHTFAGTTPRLQRLELAGCSVNIRSSIFTDLTRLELHHPPQAFTAADLFAALHKMPRLASLSLINVLHRRTRVVSTHIEPVTLLSLESLHIKGESFVQDLEVLSHISFPAHTTLWFSSDTEGEASITLLLQFLKVHRSSRQRSSTIVVESIELRYLYRTLMFDLNAQSNDTTYTAGLVKFDLNGPWMDDYLDVSRGTDIPTLFSFFDLTSLEYLGIMDCRFNSETWTDIFGSLPKLKDIAITGLCGINFLSSLIADYKSKHATPKSQLQMKTNTKGKKKKGKGKGGKGKQQMPIASAGSTSTFPAVDWAPVFPSLEKIQLEEMVFTQNIFEDLDAVFVARKLIKKEIKTFVMTECRNVHDYMVAMLQGAVGNVEWDEWKGTEMDYEDEMMYDSGGFGEYYGGLSDDEWGMYNTF